MAAVDISVRGGFSLLALAAASLVGAALLLGELLGLQPCPLCIFQRLLFLLIMLIAIVAVAFPAFSRLWGLLTVSASAGGVATAGYQSWLQYFPSVSLECGFGEPTTIEQIVDWFGVRWPSLFMATGFCSSKDWVFLGLSMANWSALAFFVLMVAGGLFMWRTPGRNR